ncbi:hypothetical protein SAMN05421736_11581 [Evansella caseinilytica]|uniref:Uncharacterized protein n=1 Tax=Evansella caseinilytica TaxID=1503961 RepID=A0A1H3TPJ5_9BACI|nr:hypothetical protein [Evansella caseinilytica]SDZ51259.1 hypothetical protein SAMN05421736_11581 [Evansella caseinilytica]
MKGKVTFEAQEVCKLLAQKIASLEIQLASEQTAKQAIVKYTEELEQKLEKYEEETGG